ncbi:MAG: aspartate kinase [Flavobacteriaceae bacterium]|nr:aspartate kinase [Flavobacteriaceae bacterium]
MRIFKFGGASVKDAQGVKNVVRVLKKTGFSDVLIVVSAMGKMTNAFEKITDAYFYKKEELAQLIAAAHSFHTGILDRLFKDRQHAVYQEVAQLFLQLEGFMVRNRSTDYDYVYDQIVSTAELLSSKIVSRYLNETGIANQWLDVRDCIRTDNDFRDAKVDWHVTEQLILKHVEQATLYITQGFIAKDNYDHTTTLGREGSDYTAGIFAYCLNAESLTIWKDVPGVLNADPRYFADHRLLEQISYTEAIELAFYGASVIHPKTLQPLQKKEIPLYVRSFEDTAQRGTVVTRGSKILPEVPCFIVKKDQILLSLSTLDFSFIVEQNISKIFGLLHTYKMKVNVIQNSAISFSVCMEDKYLNFEHLLSAIKGEFRAEYFKGVTLYTVRHFDESAVMAIEKGHKILLKQITKDTVQLIIE